MNVSHVSTNGGIAVDDDIHKEAIVVIHSDMQGNADQEKAVSHDHTGQII